MASVTPIVVGAAVTVEKVQDLPPLTVYALPISGAGFVAQVGLLSELYEAKWIACDRKWNGSKDYQPDLVLAASGGNVATYMALAGDWSPEGMLRASSKFDSEVFLRSWWPKNMDFLPTWVLAPFNGALYRPGTGAGKLFSSLFTTPTIQRTEIWTGTYDADNQRAQFFSNKAPGTTMINPDHFDRNASFFGCMPLKHLSGCLTKIATASIASASIPVLVSKQQLDGFHYSDGGGMFASPMIVMASEIYRLIMSENPYRAKLSHELAAAMKMPVAAGKVDASSSSAAVEKTDVKVPLVQFQVDAKTGTATVKTDTIANQVGGLGQRSLRLVYVCSYEMDVPKGEVVAGGQASRFSQTLGQLIHANILQDRASAIQLLMRICGEDGINVKYQHHAKLNRELLAEVLKELNTHRHYVLFLYPHGAPSIGLTSFTSADVEEAVETTRAGYGCHVWYFPYPTQ